MERFKKIINKIKMAFTDLNIKEYVLNSTIDTPWETFQVELHKGSDSIGFAKISQYPGCCGICVIHGIHINSNYRGKGYGIWFWNKLLEIAKNKKYTVATCTTNQHSTEMVHLLEKTGFVSTMEFINIKTGNTVKEWFKNL